MIQPLRNHHRKQEKVVIIDFVGGTQILLSKTMKNLLAFVPNLKSYAINEPQLHLRLIPTSVSTICKHSKTSRELGNINI